MSRSVLKHMFVAVCLGALTLGAAACGGDDPCASKTCEFGVCQSGSGDCVNKDVCQVDAECTVGFVCGQGNECVPQEECSDGESCTTGVCESGTCVNPDSCETNDECLDRTYCGDDGTCQPDPCRNVSCRRGVCQPGTDNCVSADSCTQRTERVDCIAGEKCLEGSCVTSEEFCSQLSCERGVCSFEEDGCINAPDCAGERSNCREGFYCNDMNRCQADLCVQGQVDCGDNGVCVPSTGKCENADECESSSDCVEGHLCITEEDGSTARCRLESSACGNAGGDGGCPGNQICQYNADANSASCVPPERCETSIDCIGEQQCGGADGSQEGTTTCLAATMCQADPLEPNNMASESTSVSAVSETGSLEATLCQDDTDVYTFSKSDFFDESATGTLIVDMTIPRRDIGLGEAEMTLIGPDDTELATKSLGAMGQEGSMRISQELQERDEGPYTVEITTGDEMTQNGLNYDMSVNLVSEESLNACENAQLIEPGQRLTGDTGGSTSTSFGSTCTTRSNPSPEDIYRLELDRPQQISIEAMPRLDDADISLSLRSSCADISTERACAQDFALGRTESLQSILSAGTYFLVVQAGDGASLGSYDLNVERNYFTACGGSDNFCRNGNIAVRCTLDGGRFEEVDCNVGCDASSGRCTPPDGNRCDSARSITPPDEFVEGPEQSTTVDLRQYRNDYDLSGAACISGSGPTLGPDATFEVTVPADTVLTASALLPAGTRGSVYTVGNCADVAGTCERVGTASGSASGPAETFITNESDSSVTRTVIVDSAANQPLGVAQVEFDYTDVVCTPNDSRCNQAGNAEFCNEKGDAIANTQVCGNFGCYQPGGVCAGNTCSAPANITQQASQEGGVTFSDIPYNQFTNEFQGDDTCGDDPSNLDVIDTEGEEAVFAIDMQADQIFTAETIEYGGQDTSLYIKQDGLCGTANTPCLDGEEGDTETVSVSYATDFAETIYLVMETEDDTGSTFSLKANLKDTVCPVNGSTCTSGGDVQVCKADGSEEASTYSCPDGCSGGFCNTRDAEYCWDAEDITQQLKASGGWSKTIDWANYENDLETDISCGDVDDFDNDGEDAFFKVDLQPGETLTATLDSQGSSTDPSPYIIRSCEAPDDTCLAGYDSGGAGTVTYTARGSETVFLAADHDDFPSSPDPFLFTGNIQ